MSGKWTPGPWRPDFGEVTRIRDQSGATVANITHVNLAGRRPIGEVEENAFLVAAAPDLAEAVKMGAKDLMTVAITWVPEEYQPALVATLEQMNEALAKAQGEAA